MRLTGAPVCRQHRPDGTDRDHRRRPAWLENGGFGKRELQIIALVVVGWSAVTSAAAVPYLTIGGLLYDLFYHGVVVTVPYAVGALAKRLSERKS